MRIRELTLIFGLVALLAACAKLRVNPGTATPTPMPTASGSCMQVASNTTVVIAMASSIAAVSDPTYGTINGYAAVIGPQTSFFIPTSAAPVHAHPSDIVQFANVEGIGSSVVRSAAALANGGQPATAFPAPPYTFPASQQVQTGTQIGANLWSTGRIAANNGTGYCASQQFTLATGTWYFGDIDTYDLDNRRDVIIVQ